jgi:hypothetical protein
MLQTSEALGGHLGRLDRFNSELADGHISPFSRYEGRWGTHWDALPSPTLPKHCFTAIYNGAQRDLSYFDLHCDRMARTDEQKA